MHSLFHSIPLKLIVSLHASRYWTSNGMLALTSWKSVSHQMTLSVTLKDTLPFLRLYSVREQVDIKTDITISSQWVGAETHLSNRKAARWNAT